MSVHLIYDSSYLRHDTGAHPENARRLEVILRALSEDDVLSKELKRVTPKPAANDDIARCHREELIHEMEMLCEQGASFVDVDTRISRDSFEVARLAAQRLPRLMPSCKKRAAGRSA